MHPTGDTDTAERLTCVEDVERVRGVVVGGPVLGCACTDVEFVHDEQGCAEFGGQRTCVAAADDERAVGSAFGGARPDLVEHDYIRSGADTPHSVSPLATTCRVAAHSHSRAMCTGSSGSSPRGRTRQLS